MPDNRDEAIIELAKLVALIAQRCWENLGTANVEGIVQRCGEIIDSLQIDGSES